MNASARANDSAGDLASGAGNLMMVSPNTPRNPASRATAAISSSK
jgi:hypothetical protein